MILDLLSNNEMLVYRYIESRSSDGPIRESMTSISDNVLKLYADDIPSRKVRNEDREEKLFSEATVHRAIKKMEQAGIVTIVPTKSKTEVNEIIFHGEPNEADLLEKIRSHAASISHASSRLQRTNDRLRAEIDRLQSEIEQLVSDNERMKAEAETMRDAMATIRQSALIVQKSSIVSTTKNDSNQIVLVVRQ